MFKGAGEELVEIPVDQVIFIKKIPVKGLAGDAAALRDLADSDRIDRSCLHAFLHGCGETVFCFSPFMAGVLDSIIKSSFLRYRDRCYRIQ